MSLQEDDKETRASSNSLTSPDEDYLNFSEEIFGELKA
jgi:hypothetical protein